MTLRRGSALLGTLWMIVVLGSIAMALQSDAMYQIKASRNRILLLRAAWAGTACESKIRAALAVVRGDSVAVPLERILSILQVSALTIGDDGDCRSEVQDLGAHLNVNTAAPALLECLVGRELASDIEKYRPLPSAKAVQALAALHGADFEDWMDVVGPNLFNINSAPKQLLVCLPNVGVVGARVVAQARLHSRPFVSTADFAQQLPRQQREALLLSGMHNLITVPPALLLRIVGAAGQSSIHHERRLHVQVRGPFVDVVRAHIQ